MSYLATYGKMVHRFPSTPTCMKHHLCYYISLAHVYKMHTATLNERLQDLQLIDGTLLKIKRQPCPNSPLGFAFMPSEGFLLPCTLRQFPRAWFMHLIQSVHHIHSGFLRLGGEAKALVSITALHPWRPRCTFYSQGVGIMETGCVSWHCSFSWVSVAVC